MSLFLSEASDVLSATEWLEKVASCRLLVVTHAFEDDDIFILSWIVGNVVNA
jgi:hypothetical protein